MRARQWPVDQVYVYLHPVDFRKSINGLSALVELELKLDPFMPALFVFGNRQRDKVKVLYWERNGFVLWYKRWRSSAFAGPVRRPIRCGSSARSCCLGCWMGWMLTGFSPIIRCTLARNCTAFSE